MLKPNDKLLSFRSFFIAIYKKRCEVRTIISAFLTAGGNK